MVINCCDTGEEMYFELAAKGSKELCVAEHLDQSGCSRTMFRLQKSLDVFMTIARSGLCDIITQLKERVMILQEPDYL